MLDSLTLASIFGNEKEVKERKENEKQTKIDNHFQNM